MPSIKCNLSSKVADKLDAGETSEFEGDFKFLLFAPVTPDLLLERIQSSDFGEAMRIA